MGNDPYKVMCKWITPQDWKLRWINGKDRSLLIIGLREKAGGRENNCSTNVLYSQVVCDILR